ncbi:MAG: DUF371 domain-containing protein [Candidatus Heimdallarchaeota archaeon]|nr:DUF371 domain-containing protein [Candidatus Heimdallarchaeota archaeon]
MTLYKFHCYGHRNVSSTHKTTIEFTTASNLSTKGDCILAVKSTCSLRNLPDNLKEKMKIDGQTITVILEVDHIQEKITGYGNSKLSFADENALIIRKSSFVCSRTLMINSNKAACDVSRDIVNSLTDPSNVLTVTIQVD